MESSIMYKSKTHLIQGRKVKFNFERIPKHWISNDPISTHTLNAAHIILPAGEFWFCRVFNKALPYISDEKLKLDVKGFIHQEAIHGRTHEKARKYFEKHQLDVQNFTTRMNYLFEILLGEKPIGFSVLNHLVDDKKWLVIRLGLIAAIEHYTGVVGQWSLDNKSLDDAHSIMTDLFRWHLAEEVEHRNVAFDLFKHMFESDFSFQVSKNLLMLFIFPALAGVWLSATRALLRQDVDSGKLGKIGALHLLITIEKIARKTDHLPKISHLAAATFRWFSPKFHPEDEGDTQQALEYLARSPAAKDAQQGKIIVEKSILRYS